MSPVLHLLPLLYNSQIYLGYFCITTFPSRIHTVTFSAWSPLPHIDGNTQLLSTGSLLPHTGGNTHLLSICSLLPPTSGNKHSWFVFLMYYYTLYLHFYLPVYYSKDTVWLTLGSLPSSDPFQDSWSKILVVLVSGQLHLLYPEELA